MEGQGEPRPAPDLEQQRSGLVGDLADLAGEIDDLEATGYLAAAAEGLVAAADGDEAAELFREAGDSVRAAQDAVEGLAGYSANSELSSEAAQAAVARQALGAVTALGQAESVLGQATSTVDAAAAVGPGAALKGRLKKIRAKLKGALKKLWRVVARLLTPKEWKISGEISGGIPGLGLATATVEITFG